MSNRIDELHSAEQGQSFQALACFPFTAAPDQHPSRPDTIQNRLFDTLQYRDHPEGKRFFPKEIFTDIVNEQAVREELRYCYHGHDPVAINRLAHIVCGEVSFRKVFALLSLVEKVADIHKFVQEGVSDDALPLHKIFSLGSRVFRLGRYAGPNDEVQPLHCIEGWSTNVMWMFEDWQWATQAPFFHGGERKNVCHVDLENRAPLPFLKDSRYDEVSEIIKGGYSTVFKVDIHPDHHTFRDLQVGFLPRIYITFMFTQLTSSSARGKAKFRCQMS